MDSKLTLSLNKDVIQQAKEYAKANNISLSRLIEGYLSSLTKIDQEEAITPLVKSLSGVIKLDENQSDDYTDFLANKYQ